MRCRFLRSRSIPPLPAHRQAELAHAPGRAVWGGLVLSSMFWLAAAAFGQSTGPGLDLESRPRSSAESPHVQLGRGEGPVSGSDHPIEIGARTYRVQAVDRRGIPIEGLGTRDFDVLLGDEHVKVESIRWVSSRRPVIDDGRAGAEAAERDRFLIFVQAGREPFFGRAHMLVQRQIGEFLAGLEPDAAVGVVSYDAKLKLWLDFTTDRDLTERVVAVAGRFTAEPGEQPASAGDLPSLRSVWEPELARNIANAEQSLAAMARYLNELPGTETMIYVGWGLGRFSRQSARRAHLFSDVTESLADAGVQVFVLGVDDSNLQNLSFGLLELARATGGAYFHSRDLAASRMRELAASLAAHYLLTLDKDDLAYAMEHEPKLDPTHDLEIELRFRDGRVYGPPRPVR